MERPLAAAMAWTRIGIGAAVWAAPRASMRFLGFDPSNPQVMSLARLGGTRDLALGALAAASLHDREATATIARVNAAVDALDSLAFAIALARREGIDRAALLGTTSAAGATLVGLWVAAKHESKSN